MLGIMVTEAGMVRHWPIRLDFAPSARQINVLNRFLNDNIRGHSVREAQSAVMAKLKQMEAEFRDLNKLAGELLREVSLVVGPDAPLYVDGTEALLAHAQDIGDIGTVQALMRMIGEREAIAGLLESELTRHLEQAEGVTPRPHVRIGRESGIPELFGMSLVATTYQYQGRPVGVLGVLGSKRMEYSRMISLVEYLSEIVSRKLESWNEEEPDGQ